MRNTIFVTSAKFFLQLSQHQDEFILTQQLESLTNDMSALIPIRKNGIWACAYYNQIGQTYSLSLYHLNSEFTDHILLELKNLIDMYWSSTGLFQSSHEWVLLNFPLEFEGHVEDFDSGVAICSFMQNVIWNENFSIDLRGLTMEGFCLNIEETIRSTT